MHFYESMTVLTKDDIQIKSYANEHPEGFIMGVPKYIPTNFIRTEKLQLRAFNNKEYNRFNIRAIGKDDLTTYVAGFRKYYPDYFMECQQKDTWLMGVPIGRVTEVPDSKKGAQNLLKNSSKLDEYLSLTKSLIEFLTDGGVPANSFGTTNSTLLGNYTYGKSDIDILIFGKKNYWKAMEIMQTAQHKLLRWRTEAEWKKHYIDYFPGMDITQEEYVKHNTRKKSDGLWGETVFSLFGVSEPEDEKEKFEDTTSKHLGLAKVEATITEDYDACVRPGTYKIEDVKALEGPKGININPDRIFSYSRSHVGQVLKGERVICTGMLEKAVEKKTGKERQQLTLGLFESYEKWREKELLKKRW